MIKIIIDMNLLPRWVKVLKNEGWDAVHWSSIGNSRATDADIKRKLPDWEIRHVNELGFQGRTDDFLYTGAQQNKQPLGVLVND